MSDGSQVDASTLCVEQNDPFPATPPPQPPAVADRSDKSTLANRKETLHPLPLARRTGTHRVSDARMRAPRPGVPVDLQPDLAPPACLLANDLLDHAPQPGLAVGMRGRLRVPAPRPG